MFNAAKRRIGGGMVRQLAMRASAALGTGARRRASEIPYAGMATEAKGSWVCTRKVQSGGDTYGLRSAGCPASTVKALEAMAKKEGAAAAAAFGDAFYKKGVSGEAVELPGGGAMRVSWSGGDRSVFQEEFGAFKEKHELA